MRARPLLVAYLSPPGRTAHEAFTAVPVPTPRIPLSSLRDRLKDVYASYRPCESTRAASTLASAPPPPPDCDRHKNCNFAPGPTEHGWETLRPISGTGKAQTGALRGHALSKPHGIPIVAQSSPSLELRGTRQSEPLVDLDKPYLGPCDSKNALRSRSRLGPGHTG